MFLILKVKGARVVGLATVPLFFSAVAPSAQVSGVVPNASVVNADRTRPAGPSAPAQGDSAAAAAAVERFHAAVLAGDSALALSVLARRHVVVVLRLRSSGSM